MLDNLVLNLRYSTLLEQCKHALHASKQPVMSNYTREFIFSPFLSSCVYLGVRLAIGLSGRDSVLLVLSLRITTNLAAIPRFSPGDLLFMRDKNRRHHIRVHSEECDAGSYRYGVTP